MGMTQGGEKIYDIREGVLVVGRRMGMVVAIFKGGRDDGKR